MKAIDSSGYGPITIEDYIKELWRRDQAEQTSTMRRLTVVITVCTIAVTVATILQLAIAFGLIGK